ncbi:hypothetical protein [Kingella oralis]|uniref:hypothetical protein n=1 Tax=Kingella oralis TaxID=505 RepID=UPI0034E55BA6
MTTKTLTFPLSQNQQPIGIIHWQREFMRVRGLDLPVSGSGKITGDKRAVSMLQTLVQTAVQEQWLDTAPYPTGGYPIIDPLSSDVGMVSILERAGFDMPNELHFIVEAMRGTHHSADVCE